MSDFLRVLGVFRMDACPSPDPDSSPWSTLPGRGKGGVDSLFDVSTPELVISIVDNIRKKFPSRQMMTNIFIAHDSAE
jgi:hypothetical protein